MAEVYAPATRPDIDIESDINDIIVRYPPLNNDRYHIHVKVQDGVATLTGHVKSPNTYDFFLRSLQRVEGLRGVNADYLHVDEILRLEVGKVLPPGLMATLEYGTVVLSGRLPEGVNIDEVVARLGTIPGIVRVVVALRA